MCVCVCVCRYICTLYIERKIAFLLVYFDISYTLENSYIQLFKQSCLASTSNTVRGEQDIQYSCSYRALILQLDDNR